MSGLFKRFSGRRSAGPEGSEPPTAAEHGTGDAPASPPAEPEGHRSLLTDPAAPTRVLRDGDQPASDHTTFGVPAPAPPAEGAAPAPAPSGEPAAPSHEPAPFRAAGPAPVQGPAPAPVYGPLRSPDAPAPLAAIPPPLPAPPVEPVADLPAGLDPDELAAAPGTSARRGKLRRRIAFLRAARELLLRDLGGFVYELHRTAHDVEHEAHRRLRETKLARLSRVDAELHELEIRLDDVRRQVLVREPGVGGECAHCGELYASSAHYCSNCGNPLTESARRELAKAQAPAAGPQPAPVAPVPAPVDQPTQEIGPLDPEHPGTEPEFKWPSRGISLSKQRHSEPAAPAPRGEEGDATPGAPVGETGADVAPTPPPGEDPRGEAPAPGEGASGETGYGETPAAAAPGENHFRKTPAAATPGEGQSGETRFGETRAADATGEAPAADATGEARAADATGEAPAADATGEAPAANATGEAPAADATGEAPAADATGEAPAADATGDDARDATQAGEAPAAATRGEDARGDAAAPAAAPGEGAGGETPAAATPGDPTPQAVTPVGEGDDAAATAGEAPADRPDEPADGDRPAAQGPTEQPVPDDPHRARNGTAPDDSILRPVERRQ